MRTFHAVRYRTAGEVAVLTIDNPPVNGLSHAVRLGLLEAFEHAQADPTVRAIVLTGAGQAFSAGADIRELGTPKASAMPGLSRDLHPVIERSSKPTVAAVHGIAMGGGLETALVCHYRVAAADTKVALPEVKLGLIPLSGTQRLPRAIGLAAALDLILGARIVLAREFAPGTLFDAIVDGSADEVVQAAIRYAKSVAERASGAGVTLPLVRHRSIRDTDPTAVLAQARAAAIDVVSQAAVQAIAAAVEARDFDDGLARARSIYERLSASDAAKARREEFLAERARK